MSRRFFGQFVCMAVMLATIIPTLDALAGGRGFRNSSVGGISIDTSGVVRVADVASQKQHLDELRKNITRVAGPLNIPVPLRKVSLRGLQEAIRHSLEHDAGRLPDEVRFLAGLQRIQYIFVYPEENDIVIAGPAEGWRVDEHANVVGITSGRPVLRLDDLTVALRTVTNARRTGISCSIEPTQQGMQQLQQVLDQQRKRRAPLNTRLLEPQMKKAFGPQQVKLTGIPESTHFARVLVAADYRMKRLAMNLDPSPVRGLPSYVELIRNSSASSRSNPRWWLACNYEPMARSEDGLAWELRGPGVKCLTEENFVDAEGNNQNTGRATGQAARWAELMTEHYDQLCLEDAVFGELRNLMDMCVVAALIDMHFLRDKADCPLPLLYNASSKLTNAQWNSPQTVPPECSFLKTRKGWVVTASGGVQVESWQVANRDESVPEVSTVRRDAAGNRSNQSWWWN